MTKNLETADKIAKLALALTTLVFYFFDIINGPFATGLMLLSVMVILVYFIKSMLSKGN
jgi:hypothetical protein